MLFAAAVAMAATIELLIRHGKSKHRRSTVIWHAFGLISISIASTFLGTFMVLGPNSTSLSSLSLKLGSSMCFNLCLSFGVTSTTIASAIFINLWSRIGKPAGWSLWLTIMISGVAVATVTLAIAFAVLALTQPWATLVFSVILLIILLVLLVGGLAAGIVVMSMVHRGSKWVGGQKGRATLVALAKKLLILSSLGIASTILLVVFAVVADAGRTTDAVANFVLEVCFVVLAFFWVLAFVFFFRIPPKGHKSEPEGTHQDRSMEITGTTTSMASEASSTGVTIL